MDFLKSPSVENAVKIPDVLVDTVILVEKYPLYPDEESTAVTG